MTSFAHASYPAQHPGVIRAEQAVQTFRQVVADLQNQVAELTERLAKLDKPKKAAKSE